MSEPDPYIGEIFLDEDPRSFQRRIRVTGFKGGKSGAKVWPKIVRTFGYVAKPKYSYEVIANGGNPETVGRKGTVSAKTLDNRYIQVSH